MKRGEVLLLLLFISKITIAQKIDNVYQHWYFYFGNYKINNRIAFHFDAQVRVLNGVQKSQQYLARPGFQFIFNKKMNATVGYAYIGTFSSDLDVYVPEHRVWEQLIYRYYDRYTNIESTNRIRFEQRNIANIVATPNSSYRDGWKQGNRFRYFNRTLFPLAVRKQNSVKPYLALQEEIFINFKNQKINPKTFDQNRLYGGIGLHKRNMRYEVGYMMQYINNPVVHDRINHAFHVSVFHNFDLTQWPPQYFN